MTFSPVFRLLDPSELARDFTAFIRRQCAAALGLPAPKGVVVIDGKADRRGYEKGKAHMPPIMASVWDSEMRLPIGQCGRS